MRLDTTFRLSFYLTLGLACACLAQAEAFFVFWFPFVCLPLAAVTFVLAWRHEGRWIIHDAAANYLGICLCLATVVWIILQLPRDDAELAAGGVPMPAGLLPHLGILLFVLLGVKLFRPKTCADFWAIQTIGLMIVTLGCVLAGDPLFAGLLMTYLASLVWCLALFQLYRGQRPAPTGPLFDPPDTVATHGVMPWRHLGITRALRWSLVVTVIALPLFMLMPRSGNSQWVPQKLTSAAGPNLSIGISPGINLNRVGTIEPSRDPAFHVTVTDADGRPTERPPTQLWRMEVLDCYKNGQWMNFAQAVEIPVRFDPPVEAEKIEPTMPDSRGPEQRILRFRAHPQKAGGLPLAEPVDIRHIGLDALAAGQQPAMPIFFTLPGADAAKNLAPVRGTHQYTQVLTGADSAERIPARFYQKGYGAYLASPDQDMPEAVAAWARRQVAVLPKLTLAQRMLDKKGHVAPEHHEAVSRALCIYLARSGEFRYSLTLKRHSRKIDPTADFLLNVKTGHCERFAGALALSLRGLGIPARIVKGYRGPGEEEGPGKYVIRLDQAHSWVQVLVQGDDRLDWITLDPTPGDADEGNPLVSWVAWLADIDLQRLWRRYVLNYNGDVQAGVIQHLWQSTTVRSLLWQLPAVGAGLMLAVFTWRRRGHLIRRVARRRDRAPAAPGYYARLLRVLARRFDLQPAVGQTPLEFAACADRVLGDNPATAAWATLPTQAVHALYREHFAGHSLSAAEATALAERVRELDSAAG